MIEQGKAFFVSAGTTRNILIGLIIFFYLFIITTTKSYYKLFAAYYLLLNSRPVRQGPSHLTSPSFFFSFLILRTHPHCSNFFFFCLVCSFLLFLGSGGLWGETEGKKVKQAMLVAKKGGLR